MNLSLEEPNKYKKLFRSKHNNNIDHIENIKRFKMDPKEEFIFMLKSFLHVAEQMYITRSRKYRWLDLRE